MKKPIHRIAFELWAGVGSIAEFENWVEDELRKDEPHPDACISFGLNYYDAQVRSMELASELHGFQPLSELGIEWAKEILNLQSQKLLKSEITPIEFCRVVDTFDSFFLSSRKELSGKWVYDYPDWLGDLWNCCDWCSDSWTLENSPHLRDEVSKLLGT